MSPMFIIPARPRMREHVRIKSPTPSRTFGRRPDVALSARRMVGGGGHVYLISDPSAFVFHRIATMTPLQRGKRPKVSSTKRGK
jgi:hypothetical protein